MGRPTIRSFDVKKEAALYRVFADAMVVREYDRPRAFEQLCKGVAQHFDSCCEKCGEPIHPDDTFCVACDQIGSRFPARLTQPVRGRAG